MKKTQFTLNVSEKFIFEDSEADIVGMEQTRMKLNLNCKRSNKRKRTRSHRKIS